MNAVQNTGFLNLFGGALPAAGFAAAVGYVYVGGSTNTIVVTDNTTYPGGDGLKIVNVQVTDDNGISVNGYISTTGGGGAITISTASLDATSGFNIKATVISNNHLIADLGAYGIGSSAPSSGNLAYINNQGD
jgi:hypothetical protein